MRALLLLLLCALAACAPVHSIPAAAEGLDPEEYAVYRAVLDRIYPAGPPRTVVVATQLMRDTLPDWEWMYRRDPAPPPPALVADFRAKAMQNARLDIRGLHPAPVLALRDSTWRAWNAGEAWWRGFSERHEGATDLIVLSRVGFLPDRSLALVRVIRHCLCNDSGGPTLLMRRDARGEWIVERDLGFTQL